MKATLRSVRIAPKKANLVAKMVRGMPVEDALHSLERTNKKAARLLEGVIASAAANAQQNEGQNPADLVIKTLTVNKAQTFHRGVPMARGRIRRMRKFLTHIEVTLGYPEDKSAPKEKPAAKQAEAKAATPKKAANSSSQKTGDKVEKSAKTSASAKKTTSKKTTKSSSTKKAADSSSKSSSTKK